MEIVCRQPYFELLTALSAYGTKIVKGGTHDFTTAVGTGPFRFESFEPGKQLTATASPNYWDGAPHSQRFQILSAEADARVSAVQSGQADFADDLTPRRLSDRGPPVASRSTPRPTAASTTSR